METTTPHRHNNFDFLRIAAALAVLVSHQFALSGRQEPQIAQGHLGGWAVQVFFAISGYLVAMSWAKDPHAGRAGRSGRAWPSRCP